MAQQQQEASSSFLVPVSDHKYAEETLMASATSTFHQNPYTSLPCLEDDGIIICEICAEAKRKVEMFKNQICYHSFCSECVIKQVATKIQDNITLVSCPGLNCKGVLELQSCRALLPKEIIDKWNDALCKCQEEYQKLNVDERENEDLLLRELANQKKWQRCPKCKFYIEIYDGCFHMTCRCLCEFCYLCGEEWTRNHSCASKYFA